MKKRQSGEAKWLGLAQAHAGSRQSPSLPAGRTPGLRFSVLFVLRMQAGPGTPLAVSTSEAWSCSRNLANFLLSIKVIRIKLLGTNLTEVLGHSEKDTLAAGPQSAPGLDTAAGPRWGVLRAAARPGAAPHFQHPPKEPDPEYLYLWGPEWVGGEVGRKNNLLILYFTLYLLCIIESDSKV